MSSAPDVLRSTKYFDWLLKKAMSSPFTPVMSGRPEPAVEGGGQLLEIATDDVLAHLVLRELGGGSIGRLLAEALGPGQRIRFIVSPEAVLPEAGRGARARCRRRAANQAARARAPRPRRRRG